MTQLLASGSFGKMKGLSIDLIITSPQYTHSDAMYSSSSCLSVSVVDTVAAISSAVAC